MAAMNVKIFPCTRCEHQSRDFGRLMKHYQAIHGSEAGFRVSCGIDGCCRDYSDIVYLCRHIRQKHAAFFKEHMHSSDIALRTDQCVELDESALFLPVEPSEHGIPLSTQTSANAEKIAFDYVASMSLKFREDKQVPAALCQEMRHDISFMLSSSREMLHDTITNKLKQINASVDVMNAVHNLLSTPLPYEIACDTLQNDSDLNRYIQSKFGFVKPVQYCLTDGGSDGPIKKADCMQYVPILETLKMLLQNDDIFSRVISNHQSRDGTLNDVCDGNYFRNHALFSTDEQALQIILYYDDFCPINPLGHRAKKYKIAGFYFMLGNIEPKHRSKLHSIHLAAVCFSASLKTYGFSKILQPLINDLITLNDRGVTVVRPEGEFCFKGSLLFVVADNLAAHGIGGFMESFSSMHPCRFCLISKSSLQTAPCSGSSCLRTPDTYSSQLQRVLRNKHLGKVYGIKENSCLNSIPNFHVVGGLPSDIMHDLLEGVACDVLECVLRYCVMSNFISLEYLNEQIEKFPYDGNDKVNKPDSLPVPLANFKVKQTAAKIRCLLRLLPLMIGHRVPLADSKWEVLLLLLDVHDIAMSLVLTVKDTVLLDDAVFDFVEKFCSIFPNEKIKPKMHFLTHYGEQCRAYGPLLNYWSFRFESKHSYFKDLASRLKCRKNILKTFATKHQYLQSWNLQRSGSFLSREHISSTGGKEVMVHSLPAFIQTAIVSAVGDKGILFQVSSVDVDGVRFSQNMAVVCGVSDDILCLSRIDAVFVLDSMPVFVCCKLERQQLWRHCHAYSFTESECYHVLRVTDLIDPFPLPIYTDINNHLCVILKHSLVSGR